MRIRERRFQVPVRVEGSRLRLEFRRFEGPAFGVGRVKRPSDTGSLFSHVRRLRQWTTKSLGNFLRLSHGKFAKPTDGSAEHQKEARQGGISSHRRHGLGIQGLYDLVTVSGILGRRKP